MSWQIELEKKVKKYLAGYTACHDYYHLDRVRDNAMKIAEEVKCDKEILEAAALLHDIGYRYHEENALDHPKYSKDIAKEWLPEVGFPKKKIKDVLEAIRLHDSFHWDELGEKTANLEILVLQDADRMDMLGAIGIARACYFFGEKGYPIYNEKDVPKKNIVWLNHSISDQIRRELVVWNNMNFEISKNMSEKEYEFSKSFLNKIDRDLNKYHGKEKS